MLKYLYKSIVFQEIPDETSLALAISGCQIRCEGCHSRELWEDRGTPLTVEHVLDLIEQNKGITCLLLLGGERDLDSLSEIFKQASTKVKTAWYCGLDLVPKGKESILSHLNYLKLGHYDHEFGGLDCPTTNQHLYRLSPDKPWEDITHLLQTHPKLAK